MNSIERQTLLAIGEDIDNPDVFTDGNIGQIRTSINDAIQEICMCTATYRKIFPLILYENRCIYRMPIDDFDYCFCYVLSAWDTSQKIRLRQTDLLKLQREDKYFFLQTGRPEAYYHIGHNLVGIYRKPSAHGTIIELDCVCVPQPYDKNTSNIINIRNIFFQAVVNYAASEYFASTGDAGRAEEYFLKYIQMGGFIKRDRMITNVSTPKNGNS